MPVALTTSAHLAVGSENERAQQQHDGAFSKHCPSCGYDRFHIVFVDWLHGTGAVVGASVGPFLSIASSSATLAKRAARLCR